MYADFFLDRLCNAAPVLKLFKQGLESLNDNWPDIDLSKDRLDVYAIALNFWGTLNHNFDYTELLYICHALYTQAGAKESIEYISALCGDNLNITVEEDLSPRGRFYNIKVNSVQTEYINNFQLFKKHLEDLVKDLLYYNEAVVGLYSISFECDVLNNTYLAEQVRVMNDKYAFLPNDIEHNDLFVVYDLGE